MGFTKSDLYYNDYIWTTKYNNDDPRVTGEPDSTLLSRKEGWEMLYFVNKLAKVWNWSEPVSVSSYRKIERSVREYVPNSIRSQEGIRKWIEVNYRSFWDKV